MTYNQKLEQVNPDVERAILVASVDAALEIYDEVPGATERRRLATNVLTHPHRWGPAMALVCCASAESTQDSALKETITAAWDAMAGVEPA
jgi:hypothetical protein